MRILLAFLDIFKSLFVFNGYTASEKVSWFLGADFLMRYLFTKLLKDDLFTSSTKFDVTFYIIRAAYDYQVSQVLAEKYFNTLEAPKKNFTFANSAHSPNMEEPESFIEVFRKITSENYSIE